MEILSQTDQLFLGLAVALLPLELVYLGWMTWRIKAHEAINEGRLENSWQRGYTEQRGLAVLMDLLFLTMPLGLLVLGYWSQGWMRDLVAIIVSILAYVLVLLALMLAVGLMLSRNRHA